MFSIKKSILVTAVLASSVLTGYAVMAGGDTPARPEACPSELSCSPKDCPPCCQVQCDPSGCESS